MTQPLDNITWHALTGAHARFSVGSDQARRYARGFSPIVGFADPRQADFDALVPHCDVGEALHTAGWSGPAPAGWRIEHENTMFMMLWDGGVPDTSAAPPPVPLGDEQLDQVLQLVALTQPGPFGARTLSLGDYLGCYDGLRLVAMAGERMQAGPWHEISGVCTHPEAQGQGLARRLMLELIRRQLLRGEQPFLHVMRDNLGARRLYHAMGFRDRHETIVRVVKRA